MSSIGVLGIMTDWILTVGTFVFCLSDMILLLAK